MKEEAFSRRGFMRAAGGTATAAAAGAATAGTASAQKQPAFPDYLEGAKGGKFKDARGQDSVTVKVGGGSSGIAFLPTKLWIDPGTTVTFEWVGALQHNVVPKSQPDGASWKGHEGLEGSGFTFESTFETAGIYTYFCQPHESQGMKGGIAVGEVETTGGGGGGGESKPVAWPEYVSGAKGGSTADKRDADSVTVEVGAGSSGYQFKPTKLWISPGTTVTFKWIDTGHNVVPKSQPDGASWKGVDELKSTGFTYEHTFDTGGMYTYFCEPHEGLGMKGAIAVGSDVPRASTVEFEPIVPEEAMTLIIGTMAAMGTTLGLAFAFLKYGGNQTTEA